MKQKNGRRILAVTGWIAGTLLTAACAGKQQVSGSQTEVFETGAAMETEASQVAVSETEEALSETQKETDRAEEEQSGLVLNTQADGTLEGIVVDAAMHSMILSTGDGTLYSLSLGEDEDVIRLKSGLTLGTAVQAECRDGVALSVREGEKKPLAEPEALAFAADVLFAFAGEDLQTLSTLAGYPVYVNLGEEDQVIENAAAFLELPQDQVFSPERVSAVRKADLYELQELNGGKYVLGAPEGKPGVTFQKDEGRDSGFSVTGIN